MNDSMTMTMPGVIEVPDCYTCQHCEIGIYSDFCTLRDFSIQSAVHDEIIIDLCAGGYVEAESDD